MKIVIENIGGWCPVQADGTVDGVPFYFHSRGEGWSMAIGDDPVGVTIGNKPGWVQNELWGTEPFAAGYMPLDIATKIIQRCAEEFSRKHPTAEGLRRYPDATEGYWEDIPCTCQPDCPDPCRGGCGCSACNNAYMDAIDCD